MNTNIITNEWLDVATHRVPIQREVFGRTAMGDKYAAVWNGYYWCDANTGRRWCDAYHKDITHFYVFERHTFDMGQTIG